MALVYRPKGLLKLTQETLGLLSRYTVLGKMPWVDEEEEKKKPKN